MPSKGTYRAGSIQYGSLRRRIWNRVWIPQHRCSSKWHGKTPIQKVYSSPLHRAGGYRASAPRDEKTELNPSAKSVNRMTCGENKQRNNKTDTTWERLIGDNLAATAFVSQHFLSLDFKITNPRNRNPISWMSFRITVCRGAGCQQLLLFSWLVVFAFLSYFGQICCLYFSGLFGRCQWNCYWGKEEPPRCAFLLVHVRISCLLKVLIKTRVWCRADGKKCALRIGYSYHSMVEGNAQHWVCFYTSLYIYSGTKEANVALTGLYTVPTSLHISLASVVTSQMKK